MSLANSGVISLRYGAKGSFSIEMDARQVVASHAAPAAVTDLDRQLSRSLARPLDFPPLEQALIPDDHVAIALDRDTPQAPVLIGAIWRVLQQRAVDPGRVTILQPTVHNGSKPADPRGRLPDGPRREMSWKLHDSIRDRCAYLAASSAGDRIYLAKELIDADVVISVGCLEYDSVLGYRGTNSVFYPGLSNDAAVQKTHGQGHSELGPDDDRPLRQLIDEVGWLLGTQFTLQVVPSTGDGVAQVLAGSYEAVLRDGRSALAEHWLVELESRPEVVVVAVDSDARGHGWPQIGAALNTARNLVAREGKIVVLSELDAELGPGMELIAAARSPRDALKPLRTQLPSDLTAATQCATAADWASIYLLSQLEGEQVENLFMLPLENAAEVERLLQTADSCAFIGSAQHTHGQIRQN